MLTTSEVPVHPLILLHYRQSQYRDFLFIQYLFYSRNKASCHLFFFFTGSSYYSCWLYSPCSSFWQCSPCSCSLLSPCASFLFVLQLPLFLHLLLLLVLLFAFIIFFIHFMTEHDSSTQQPDHPLDFSMCIKLVNEEKLAKEVEILQNVWSILTSAWYCSFSIWFFCTNVLSYTCSSWSQITFAFLESFGSTLQVSVDK